MVKKLMAIAGLFVLLIVTFFPTHDENINSVSIEYIDMVGSITEFTKNDSGSFDYEVMDIMTGKIYEFRSEEILNPDLSYNIEGKLTTTLTKQNTLSREFIVLKITLTE